MVKCAIKSCGLRKDYYNHGLTLHRLPTKATERRKWIDVIGAENINLNFKTNYICSIHFEDSCFNRTLDVVRLRDNSVPSLYLQTSTCMRPFDLQPVLPAPGNKARADETQHVCKKIKGISGSSTKSRGSIISYHSVEIKHKGPHQLSDSDPLAEHPVPLCDTADTLGEGRVRIPVPQEDNQAREPRGKDDTYLTSKINTLNIRCRALNKKLKRYREVLRRREKKMADLQTDVDSLQRIISEHDSAGGGGEAGAPTIQILSSKDGVVKRKPRGQVLFIKRGPTRQKSPSDDLRTLEPLQKSHISVIRTTGKRQKSLVGDLPTSELQRTSDIQPNALVIQIDGKHSSVLQPTLVRLQHNHYMEIG